MSYNLQLEFDNLILFMVIQFSPNNQIQRKNFILKLIVYNSFKHQHLKYWSHF